MLRIALFTLGWLFSSLTLAHPTQMGNITGENIELKAIGHGFAGAIKDRLVMGSKQHGTFASVLKIIAHDREAVSTFQPQTDTSFGGILRIPTANKVEEHRIEFVDLVSADNKYIMTVDGHTTEVYVKAEDFVRGHFINPEFSADYKGQTISFKLEGQACYRYSLQLITTILGAAIF
ncbi:MAG: hypothetical protein OXT67_03945 [Zetaproteobacteria bacterium]|nr:hypothetical protein [Zetaproteobacteria bacterium]